MSTEFRQLAAAMQRSIAAQRQNAEETRNLANVVSALSEEELLREFPPDQAAELSRLAAEHAAASVEVAQAAAALDGALQAGYAPIIARAKQAQAGPVQ